MSKRVDFSAGGGWYTNSILPKEAWFTMRVILDTDKGRIILPKSFFTNLDKMNRILAEGGSDKKWSAEEYVRDQFEKAMKETMLRAEDKVVK